MSLTDRLFGGFGFSTRVGLSGLGDLKERRLAEAQAKYPGAEPTVKRIADADPSGNQKYLGWQLKQVLDLGEPMNEVIDLVAHFHRVVQRLPQKDLYSFKTLGQLRAAIEAIPSQSAKAVVAELKAQGAKLLHDTEHVAVLYLKDREASCLYGSGTQWCIAATKSRNYFYSYSMRDVHFYIVIAKALQGTDSLFAKVAFAMQRPDAWKADHAEQLWGKTDNELECHQRRLQIFNRLDECLSLSEASIEYAKIAVKDKTLKGRLPEPPKILLEVILPHFEKVEPRPEHTAYEEVDLEALTVLLEKAPELEALLSTILARARNAVGDFKFDGKPISPRDAALIEKLKSRVGQRFLGKWLFARAESNQGAEGAPTDLADAGLMSDQLWLGMIHQRFIVERRITGLVNDSVRRLAAADEFAFALMKMLERGTKSAIENMRKNRRGEYYESFLSSVLVAVDNLSDNALTAPAKQRVAMAAMFKKISRFVLDSMEDGLGTPNNLSYILNPEFENGADFALTLKDKERLMLRHFLHSVHGWADGLSTLLKVFAHHSIPRELALEVFERVVGTPAGWAYFHGISLRSDLTQRNLVVKFVEQVRYIDEERFNIILRRAKSTLGEGTDPKSQNALVQLRRTIAEDKKRKKTRR
jgi:hypothetical protein